VEAVDAGRFDPLIRTVSFSLDDFRADPAGTNAKLLGVLHGA
jgi:urea carboxylase